MVRQIYGLRLGCPARNLFGNLVAKLRTVIIYSYGGKSAEVWWDKVQNGTTRFKNLSVMNISETNCAQLGDLASRSMQLQVNIQDGDVMVSVGDTMLYVTPSRWK